MKLTEKIKPLKKKSNPILQVKKGEVTITLTDVKTGEKTVMTETNMQTNAINEMLRNCGWLNRDNIDQANLVTQLLGGVLLLNTEITEDADIITVPSEELMIANASVDNTSIEANDPSEIGLYKPDESGWQGDGSFLFTYDWGTTQGNCPSGEAISAICATNKYFGYAGDGNSLVAKNTKTEFSLRGTSTAYRILGIPCKLSLEDSSIYGIDFSDLSNGNVTIRKYRLPIGKVNLKGTPTEPFLLSEVTLSGSDVPANLKSAGVAENDSYVPCRYKGTVQDTGETLAILSVNTTGNDWGNGFTQYLWEVDPEAETITESTLLNTSGDTLKAMTFPIWFGKDMVAFVNGYDGYTYGQSFPLRDGRYVYSMKRTNGVWSSIQKADNPIGRSNADTNCGWYQPLQISGDKGYINGGYSVIIVFDYVNNEIKMTNASYSSYENRYPSDAPLIRYNASRYGSGWYYDIEVKRTQCCIATIYNPSTPYVKDATKTMKLQYRFEFEETEEE